MELICEVEIGIADPDRADDIISVAVAVECVTLVRCKMCGNEAETRSKQLKTHN